MSYKIKCELFGFVITKLVKFKKDEHSMVSVCLQLIDEQGSLQTRWISLDVMSSGTIYVVYKSIRLIVTVR